jgi:ribosomal-protein-alanine acetyltransferase
MPGEFLVRRAKPADLDRILKIEDESFGRDAYERKLFAAYLRKSGDFFLVARQAGEICGYILARPIRGRMPAAELVSIAVARAMRGTGAGLALMNSAWRVLSRRGIVRLVLMVKVTNRRARRFYDRYGFEKIRIVAGYYEDGRDGLLMEKIRK